MQVQSIQNNKSNTIFSGSVCNNQCLQNVMKSASKFELNRFSEVLDIMEKADDRLIWKLDEIQTNKNISFFNISVEGLKEKDYKGLGTIKVADNKGDNRYTGVLEKFNNYLESQYLEFDKAKNKLIENISKKLKQQ